MEPEFKKIIDAVAANYEQCKSCHAFTLKKPPPHLPQRGIYILCEGETVLYVGRSNRIKQRLRDHICNSHFKATFAFLLAREATGNLKPSYKKEGSRAHLLKGEKFQQCFNAAREKISKMNVLVLEEVNPTKQALLEIYAATVTNAPYSAFDNH